MLADGILINKRSEEEYIIKNPVTGNYLKLGCRETAYLVACDEGKKICDVDIKLIDTLSDEEKNYLAEYYYRNHLWVKDDTAGAATDDTSVETQRKENIKKGRGFIKNLSLIKVITLNPNKFLERTKKYLSWMFSLPFFIGMMLLFVGATFFLASIAPELDLDELLHVEAGSIVYLVIAILPTGVVHELAHSVACKHYGGDVTKVGFVLFYFMPSFYADVSDIYMVRRRKHKLIICLAGIFSNFILGTMSLIAFCLLQKKGIYVNFLFYYYVFNIGTGIYNLFPFVKMDGYWILQCMCNESNLMGKAKTMLYMALFKNKKYRGVLPENKKKKKLYLFCGSLMVVFSFLFWIYAIDTVHGILMIRCGDVVTWSVTAVASGVVVASLISDFLQCRQMSKLNNFGWSKSYEC